MSERFKVVENSGMNFYNWALIDTKDNNRKLGTDGGEPEDQTLVRDWSWVANELNALDDEIERLKAALDGGKGVRG